MSFSNNLNRVVTIGASTQSVRAHALTRLARVIFDPTFTIGGSPPTIAQKAYCLALFIKVVDAAEDGSLELSDALRTPWVAVMGDV